MRIMALDVGSKRIGVAVSDPMRIIVQPLEVIQRKSINDDLKKILELISVNEVSTLVVGVPYADNGGLSVQAKKIISFKDKLAAFIRKNNINSVVIELIDETMTNHDAHESMKNAGIKHSKRRSVIDKMAAVMILEDYLRANNQ